MSGSDWFPGDQSDRVLTPSLTPLTPANPRGGNQVVIQVAVFYTWVKPSGVILLPWYGAF